jgi:hypothetical protein
MVGQVFDLLGQSVGVERFHGVHNACVQHSPPLQQEAAVGHLVRQGMLENIDLLGEQTSLVEELCRLEVCQATV